MFISKNIWSIFYLLVVLGSIYLLSSIYYTWQDIKRFSNAELSYINRVFSSSVSSNFDQQEIMLNLLGQQLINAGLYRDQPYASTILDELLQQNRSLVATALSDLDGNIIASSSNLDLRRLPNLKSSKNSRETFIHALQSEQMVLGKTYFYEPAKSWVIPMRKAIRDRNGQLMGVMIAGTRPSNLLPMLNGYKNSEFNFKYESVLIQDKTFNYSYINAQIDVAQMKQIIDNAVPLPVIEQHDLAMQKLGSSFAILREKPYSAEYFAQSTSGTTKLFSLLYIPKYQLWSMTAVARDELTQQLINSSEPYVYSSVAVLIILYFLFKAIDKADLKKREELREQANHDFLTGLHNRQFLSHAEADWIGPRKQPFSVFFTDLDRFKNINDSYGHSYGDIILKKVAERLREFFSSKQIICRQGGDEFIILTHETDMLQIEKTAQDLLKELSRPYRVDHFHFIIGASIGISRYPQDGNNFESLFSAADSAMYQAKSRRNNYSVFTKELHQQSLLISRIEQAMHNALKNDEFSLAYQPQINRLGKLYGIEALIRWHNPELGYIAPNQFIKIAEESGYIIPLGHFILERAISDLSQLAKMEQRTLDFQLSINVSVRQLQEESFPQIIDKILNQHHFSPRNVTLEITESIFIEDYDYLMPVLNEIRQMGCQFSLDDFGTGYSSLSMLRNLPIDELKIDKSFIDQVFDCEQNKVMVLNIINISKNLGLNVIAEGIENQQQADLLIEYGCDVQQGYLYAKPMPFNELQQFYRTMLDR